MIFTSFEFVAFFATVLLIRSCITRLETEKWFLIVVSYLFYMSWSVPCVTLIMFTSGVDYWVGLKLGQTESQPKRRALLIISIVLNLGLLGFFKYTNFLIDTTWWGLGLLGVKLAPVHYKILLPVGISFFTFQSMTYTIDVYRRHIEPCRKARDFFLFAAFFPQLVAGPIVRASSFLPQLAKRVRGSAADIEYGLVLFVLGAVKKMTLSDQIAGHVDAIFANPSSFTGLSLLLGVLGYAIQIYCDFSGYSDMAIGCARIMGYRFPENFAMPYSSINITEFWRRWHMSLSSWLRDYLYIPLGGNRLGVGRTYVNLMLVMLIGGLWHGASWNFVIWGAIHGAGLCVHKLWLTHRPAGMRTPKWLSYPVSHTITLAVVLIGWIFFRAQTFDSAGTYLVRLFSWQTTGVQLVPPQILIAIAVVVLVHLCISKDRPWVDRITQSSWPLRIAAYTALALILVCLGATDASPFIYFQF